LKGGFRLPIEDQACAVQLGERVVSYLGHEDIFSSETVERTTIVVINGRNGDVCVLSQKVHGRHFRFGLDSRHEPASDPRNKFKAIDEGDYISLDKNQ